jgi:hypothetical protein
MALALCSCGRHVRTSDRACPFCGSAMHVEERRLPSGQRSRAAALACVAAITASCAARTGLDVTTVDDASADAAQRDAPADAIVDAREENPFVIDAQPADVIDECLQQGATCTANSDCCSGFCGFHHECDMSVPPYGGSPPVD